MPHEILIEKERKALIQIAELYLTPQQKTLRTKLGILIQNSPSADPNLIIIAWQQTIEDDTIIIPQHQLTLALLYDAVIYGSMQQWLMLHQTVQLSESFIKDEKNNLTLSLLDQLKKECTGVGYADKKLSFFIANILAHQIIKQKSHADYLLHLKQLLEFGSHIALAHLAYHYTDQAVLIKQVEALSLLVADFIKQSDELSAEIKRFFGSYLWIHQLFVFAYCRKKCLDDFRLKETDSIVFTLQAEIENISGQIAQDLTSCVVTPLDLKIFLRKFHEIYGVAVQNAAPGLNYS